MMSRRTLLRQASRMAAGITVFAAAPACAFNPLPAMPTRDMPKPEARIAWLRRLPDGRVRLLLPRQEMGQGVSIALRQIVAEELDVDLTQVEAVLPATSQIAPVRATVGSDSIKDFALPVARAAALLREYLAAGNMGGEIVDDGQAVTLRSFTADMPRRYVGQALPTQDVQAIVTGQPLYAGDIRLPGMLHGLVLVADVPAPAGLRKVTLSDGRQGLLAEHPATLQAAAFDLAQTDLPARAMPDFDIDTMLARGSLEHVLRRDRIAREVAWSLDRRYEIPFAAHASIETRSAVAQWHDGGKPFRLEVWTASQDIFFVRATLARQFGLAVDQVQVHGCRIGGGFGARAVPRQEVEAALLSQAAGRPVKVQWSRAAEFRHGFHRPPSAHRIRARLDAAGRIADWWHGFCSGHVIFTSAAMPGWMQTLTGFVADPGVARGAVPPYRMARQRIEFSDIRLPIDTGPWRGLGAGPNGFAIESALDELAALAGRDPIGFRLDHLGPDQARLAACLRRVAEMAGAAPSDPHVGRGVACGIYKETSYAALIADMYCDPAGSVRPLRLYCAQDSGLLVNPDQVRAQVEGNLLWGLGMVLHESLAVADGRVAASSFADYALPRLADMPEIKIDLLQPAGALPAGAGETAMVAAAAISNAIAAATGRRVLRLPYMA